MKFMYIDIFAKIYDKTDFVIVNYEINRRNSYNISIYSIKVMQV